MQPTQRAIAMLPALRQSFKLIERAITPPEDFVPAESERRFIIASTDYFEMAVLLDLVSYLQRTAPRVSIEIDMTVICHPFFATRPSTQWLKARGMEYDQRLLQTRDPLK